MKKVFKIVLFILIVVLIIVGIYLDLKKVGKKEMNYDKESTSYNKWLHTSGNKLLNEKNEVVVLKGISTHGIQWFKDLYTYDNIKYLKDEFGINVFRIALYSSPKANGYVSNKELKEDVYKIVDYCLKLDIYVIIDWHILDDNNPKTYEKESIEFFSEVSNKYKDTPNVIYEICNEPNGDTKWLDVREYAENVIKEIRKNSKKSLIIVGTPNWSKELDRVANYPLEDNNVIYALHFYSGTDNAILRKKVSRFLNRNLPVFVSECGITDNTGDGKIYEEEFNNWISYLKKNDISWIFWSFSNKNEASSILKEDYDLDKNIDDYLSDTGIIIKKIMKEY